jgi:hypothetical protein
VNSGEEFRSFTGLRIDREPWQYQTGRPRHSHSIVSETTKLLIQLMEIFRLPPLTVRFAVKKCRLVPIDGDRWRTIPVDHIAGFTTIR